LSELYQRCPTPAALSDFLGLDQRCVTLARSRMSASSGG
jgi:hypothetical protein